MSAAANHFSSMRLALVAVLIVLFCAAAALTIVGESGGADVVAVIQ